jgi:transcriptional regulator with XRE-family HTH domain
MTQADVAKAMGVSQPRVARIESGKNVSLEALRKLREENARLRELLARDNISWEGYSVTEIEPFPVGPAQP